MTNDREDLPKSNYSITQTLLAKTYGEPHWNENWPLIDKSGGFIILGAKQRYNYKKMEMVPEPNPTETWCWWGWNAGQPVRFDSIVDAETFCKTLTRQDESGRPYDRGLYLTIVEANGRFYDDDNIPCDDGGEE